MLHTKREDLCSNNAYASGTRFQQDRVVAASGVNRRSSIPHQDYPRAEREVRDMVRARAGCVCMYVCRGSGAAGRSRMRCVHKQGGAMCGASSEVSYGCFAGIQLVRRGTTAWHLCTTGSSTCAAPYAVSTATERCAVLLPDRAMYMSQLRYTRCCQRLHRCGPTVPSPPAGEQQQQSSCMI